MSETLARDAEDAGGLLDFVRLVPGRLSVLHLRDLQILTDFIKVLLGLLEFADVPDGHKTNNNIKTLLEQLHAGERSERLECFLEEPKVNLRLPTTYLS